MMSEQLPAKKEPKELEVTYGWEPGSNITITKDDVRNYLAPGAKGLTDAEILLFLKLCQYRKLNPFIREAYIVKYSERDPASMIVSKDVFLKRAENHKMYDGLTAGIIIGKKSAVVGMPHEIIEREGTIVLDNETLLGGWCKVRRRDRSEPHFVTVSLKEYAKRKAEGGYTKFWADLMATMIRKVAMVHALREAFPGELGGMYTEDEQKFEKTVETPAVEVSVYEVPTALLDSIYEMGEQLGLNQGQIRQSLAKYKGKEEELAKDLEELVRLREKREELQPVKPEEKAEEADAQLPLTE